MGFLSKIAGLASGTTGIGTIAGIAGAGADFFSAKHLQNDAQSYGREQWRNKHQWEVRDLKKAGLNPILSAHSGGSPSSGGIANASPGSTAINAARAMADIKLTNATTARTVAETALTQNKTHTSDPYAYAMEKLRDYIENLGNQLEKETTTAKALGGKSATAIREAILSAKAKLLKLMKQKNSKTIMIRKSAKDY